MNIAIVHKPEAGTRPWFLVARLRNRSVEDGGYATREEADANRHEFAQALRGAFA